MPRPLWFLPCLRGDTSLNFNHTQDFLSRCLEEKAFPSCQACVGSKDKDLFRWDSHQPSLSGGESLYDLASLTKLIATAMLALRLHDRGIISLNQPLSHYWKNIARDKADITIKQILTHTGGFEAHWMLEKSCPDPDYVLTDILTHPLKAEPGTQVIYSCMGYILLGILLEKAAGAGLDHLARELVFSPLAMNSICYLPVGTKKKMTVHTEWDKESGCYLSGMVHDENARFMRGVSGNAGLFSSIDNICLFARMLLNGAEGFLKKDTFDLFKSNLTPRFESFRGLGVEIKKEGKSWPAGPLLSKGSYGHTGFTGTSLYIDQDRELFFILLTNRVYYGRNLRTIPPYRALYHQYIFEDLEII